MNKSYLSSINNTALSLKPSKAIRLLLVVLFFNLIGNVASAQNTLFQFNFENSIVPNVDNVVGTPAFTSNGLGTVGYTTTTPCQGARMYTADNWNTGDSYQFTFNATGFANMAFSFCNRTDNTSIGTFIVRVSADNGANWTPVLTSYTPTSANNTLTTATFPVVANNATAVLIQIYKTNNANNSNRDYLIDNATLTGYSIPTISSFTPNSGCSNSASVVISGTNFTGVTGVRFGGTNAASYVVNSSTQITAIPAAAGTTGAITVVTSGGTATSGSSFTVNAVPTTTSAASLTSVASGGNVTLTASATPTTQNAVLLYEGFNGTTNSWTKANNSTGGTPANAAWTLRPNGYNYNYGGGYSANTFYSNDNSQFYLSNSAAQGSANTNTILQSPVMNTVGYTSLSLDFYQFIREFDNTNFSYVEVSTNNSIWTIVDTYNTNSGDEGADDSFVQKTINLNSYINQATLYIRFRYVAQFDWFWAIDNVTISGNKTIDYTYSWTALPSGTAGLPSGAGTSSTSNNSIVARPTFSTAYTVTATNPVTGCSGTSSVNVTVLVPTITSLSSTSGCVGSTITINGTNLSGATAANVRIGGTAVSSITSISATQIVAVIGVGTTGKVTVTNSGGTATSSSVFTVNALPTITLGVNPIICENVGVAYISYTATSGSPDGYGVDFDAAANTAGFQDFSNWALTPGKLALIIPNGGWNITPGVYYGILSVNNNTTTCVSVQYHISITISNPTAPTVGTTTQPDCTTTKGSVELSGLPASGTINQTRGTVITSYPITGTTMTISGLVAGTYNFSVSIGGCSSSATGDVVIIPAVTNTWTTSWSNGAPNNTQKLVFAGNYPPAVDPKVDIVGCSCLVSGSVEVTIKSGRTLTITNEVTVVGGGVGAGSLIFENNASLVQINNTPNINSGDIEYQRETNSVVRKTDYVYWSSPVFEQDLGNLSAKTANGTFYSFDTGTEDWSQAFGGTMDIGKGYIVRRPDFISGVPVMTETYTAYFVGVPNNGTITIPSGYSGNPVGTSNLLGNPYPSAIDADKFLAANAGVLDGTLYFWTHNTALNLAGNISNPGPGWAYTYSLDDYASYNITGGVGTAPDITASAPSDPNHSVNGVDLGKKPTGKIAAGQGFFATSIGSGSVTFTNAMRVAGTSGNNTQFFKTKNPNGKTANTIEKNRVWLNLTNTLGAFKQTLIGYVTDATNEYDSRFDGESFDANEFVDFYSVNQDKNLVIQGRALPFDETDEVQLGFRTTIDGTFTINIDQVDGLLTNQAVFIEDKLTNTVFDLKSGNYTFSTTPGTFNDRFVLRYTNKTLGTDNFDSLENKVLVSNANKQIKINSFAETIDKVAIYDLLGKQIYQKTNVDTNELSISNLVSSHQVVIVKTVLQNGQEVNTKIVF